MSFDRERIAPFIIFLFILLVYIAFLTKNYYWDGIEFAQTIESAAALDTTLLHPNHLIYNALGYIVYKGVLGAGIDARAVTVLQIMNSVFSAFAAFVLFHILKESFRSTYLSAALTFVFAFSALWWKFSTDANSYIPSILFLIIGFYLILPGKKPRPSALAAAHIAAMCFHQLAVFFFPVAILGLYFQTAGLPRQKRFAVIAQYAALAPLVTFGIFCAAFYLQTGGFSVSVFQSWITNYSPENGFLFNLKDCLKYTLGGEVKLFFGGRFSYLKEVLNPFLILPIGLLMLVFIGLIIQIIRLWKTNRAAKNPDGFALSKPLAALAAVWTAGYLAFLFFWIPQNTFYRMFYLPALIILTGILLNRFRLPGRTGWRTALFAAVAALSNFLFYIYPYAQVRAETPLSMAVEMQKLWSPKTVVYYSKLESDNRLSKYFNPATVWKKLDRGVKPEEFESEVRNVYAQGGEVWLETWAIAQFRGQTEFAAWLARHTAAEHKVNNDAYNVEFVKVAP
ncbi:MAG TPA: hypothetical protein VGC97_04505 [Pyrinomonadaceae bacterium]|jgi:hypothetical protein